MAKYKTPKIEELFEAGVHIGHQAKRWHPKMEPYIYTTQNKVHVFDLEQTETLLSKACEFLFEAAKKGGQIVFVGTKRQASGAVKEAAKRSGALYVTERWIGGTVTNYKMIKKNMDKLVRLMRQREDGSLAKYTKKERLLIDKEIDKLERNVGGLVNIKGTPVAVVLVDPRKEKTAVRESVRAGIPVVALIDTNADPSNVSYVIPGNDDAIKSITLIVTTLANAVEEGYKEYAKIGEKAAKAEEKAKAKVENEEEKEITPIIIKTESVEKVEIDAKDLPKEKESVSINEDLKK